jgi:hypothetical protein
MFFKHKHLLEDLRKNGRSARAPERQRQGLEFVFVPNVDEALRAALAKRHVKGFEPPA